MNESNKNTSLTICPACGGQTTSANYGMIVCEFCGNTYGRTASNEPILVKHSNDSHGISTQTRPQPNQQIQCPKCNGFKVSRDEEGSAASGLFHIIMIIVTAGLWLLVILFINALTPTKPVKSGDKLKCDICGYTWQY